MSTRGDKYKKTRVSTTLINIGHPNHLHVGFHWSMFFIFYPILDAFLKYIQ